MHGLLKTIILLGAIQGFIMSLLLFNASKNRQSNRILSILIFLMALASLNLYAQLENWYQSSAILHFINLFIPTIIIMPFGPLIYFYVKSSLDPSFKLSKRQRIHFYPVAIDVLPQLTVIIYIICLMFRLIRRNDLPWGNFIDTYNVYSDIPRWISITTYLWLTASHLSSAKRSNAGNLNGQSRNYKWLQQFVQLFLGFQLIWLIFLIPYVIPRYTDRILNSVDWYPVYVPMAILVYWFGIKGYLMSGYDPARMKKGPARNHPVQHIQIDQTISLLKKSMEEDKLYLDPELNLSLLGQMTGIGQKTISLVLNQYLHKSFNDFVNEYRVKALQEKILLSQLNHLTIEGIAAECGFNSKATYQRAFKEFTGFSPSEYRKSSSGIGAH